VLKGQISAAIAGDGPAILDEMTVAHLEECLSRINLTLQAPMGRGGNVGITLMF
jgi:hypothetical protein